MPVLSICNHKGGTGKTTTAIHMTAAFGLSGHRVLAVDLDPQGFLTRLLGVEEPPEARSSLAGAIGEEIDALRAFESDLSGVDRRRRRLLEHLDGVSGSGADAAIDVWERLEDLERECDEIAAERQESLADPPMTPGPAVDVEGDRAFYDYLYAPTDGPRHPVLAQVSELAERIRADRDRVASRLAGGR